MSEEQAFKIVLRGFDREAVVTHIEKLRGDHQQEADALRQELTALRAQQAETQTQMEEGEKLRSEMQTAMAGAQEFINAQDTKLRATAREVEDLKKKNALYLDKQEALTRLLAEAQVKCVSLVEEAQRHADHITGEAQRECEQALEKANTTAANIIAQSKQDAEAVQTALRKRFSTITDTVSAIRQLSGQMASCCDAADQMIAEPDSFFYEETNG